MRRHRTRTPFLTALLAVIALTLALIASGCGGDDSSNENPRTLLGKASAKPIPSATVQLRTVTNAPGFPILGSRISVNANGPFEAKGKGGLPAFDSRVILSGGGQTFPARVSLIDGSVYVELMGQFYEADKEMLGQLGLDELKAGPGGASLQQLGLDPDEWLTNVKVSDGEELGGDSTKLITGKVNKQAVIEDLLGILNRERLEQASEDLGDLPDFSDENIDKAAAAIDSAQVEINVDDDDNPRRVYAKLGFTVPDDVKDTAIEKGTVVFDLQLDQIGEVSVNVEPPFDPDPLSSLIDFAGVIFGVDEISDLWRQPN